MHRGRNMNRSMGTRAILGFGLVFVVLVSSAAISSRNLSRLHANEEAIAHTHQVLAELEAVLSTMKDAETGQRGFLLTGDAAYLKPYEDAALEVQGRIER